MLLRALIAFLALPGIVAFVLPLLIAWLSGWEGGIPPWGIVAIAPGLALLLWCVREFYVAGRGTLAPWSPPRRLVTTGPYRRSRNPMYVAVTLILLGWAVAFSSARLVLYAGVVAAAFLLRVRLAEEPRLAQTFREEWKRYVIRTPRWIFPNRRGVLAFWVAAVLAVPIAGLVYEAFADARAAREFPPPGMLVDLGGYHLHLLCIGKGAPVVMFEASGWGTAVSAAAARERIAQRTTVCSYDRPGQGWSEPAPGEGSIGNLARDLAVLQDRARVPSPLVVVASSIGGLTAEMFARQYRDRVAGLVFVDAASSLVLDELRSRSSMITTRTCGAAVLARVGVVRLMDPFHLGDGSESARRGAGLAYNARSWAQLCALARALSTTASQFASAPPLDPNVPMVVLSAPDATTLLPPGYEAIGADLRSPLTESHQQLARRSSRGTWRVIPESTHLIGESQPDAIADAVFDILDAVR